MSHHFIGLDPDEMTPRQLRLALRHAASAAMTHGARKKKEAEESDKPDDDDDEAEEESKENDDLVDLAAEQGGGKSPKVTKDDMPRGLEFTKHSKSKGKKES